MYFLSLLKNPAADDVSRTREHFIHLIFASQQLGIA